MFELSILWSIVKLCMTFIVACFLEMSFYWAAPPPAVFPLGCPPPSPAVGRDGKVWMRHLSPFPFVIHKRSPTTVAIHMYVNEVTIQFITHWFDLMWQSSFLVLISTVNFWTNLIAVVQTSKTTWIWNEVFVICWRAPAQDVNCFWVVIYLSKHFVKLPANGDIGWFVSCHSQPYKYV